MKWKTEYLSEEELQILISEVEQTDMVAAPPELTQNVLSCIAEEFKKQEFPDDKDKKKEYRSYCFRVWTSVAAAIALLFILPRVMELQLMQETQSDNSAVMQESVLFDWTYKDSEKNQKETELFEYFLGGYNFFGNNDKFNIFKERNGGGL